MTFPTQPDDWSRWTQILLTGYELAMAEQAGIIDESRKRQHATSVMRAVLGQCTFRAIVNVVLSQMYDLSSKAQNEDWNAIPRALLQQAGYLNVRRRLFPNLPE
jgi:hypothetical protein